MKNKDKCLGLGFGLYLCASAVSAQSQTDPEQVNASHALGASVGWIVGSGLSYRHYFPHQYLQTTLLASAENLNDDIKSNDDVYVDFALSYGQYLHVDKPKNWLPIGLKWFAGVEWIYEENPICEFDPLRGCVDRNVSERTIHIGTGIGIDIGRIQAQGLVFSLDLSFLATFENGKFEGVHAPWPALSVLYNW